jgi:hypothetical protein
VLETAVGLATLFVVVITPFVSRAYFGKYFEKKGENRAMHEDIRKLTELVEAAKIPFARQLDIERAELALHAKLVTAEMERRTTAIIQFYEVVLSMLARIERLYTTLSDASSDELATLSSSIDTNLFEVRCAYFRLTMLVADTPPLLSSASAVVELILTAEPKLIGQIRKLRRHRQSSAEASPPSGGLLGSGAIVTDSALTSALHESALQFRRDTASALSEFVGRATLAIGGEGVALPALASPVGVRFLGAAEGLEESAR